jgi:lysophospholipase L1-like esterase
VTRPLDTLIAKLKAGQNACWLGVGDSTYYGTGPGGWPRIFGKLVGEYLGCIVRQQTSRSASEVIYNPPTGGTGATLLLTNIGGGGTTYAVDLTQIDGAAAVFQSPNLASTPPDAVILWGGFNDVGLGGLTPSQLGAAANTIVERIRSRFGTNPRIIVSTQNASKVAKYQDGHVGLVDYFSDQSTLPLTPALIPGKSAFANLWCLDSHQAWGVLGTTDTLGFSKYLVDSVHPNLAGYTLIAQWMFDQLVKDDIPETPTGSSPVVTTAALDEINRAVPFSQTLAASGTTPIAWSIHAGSLPDGLTLNNATGTVSGTAKANGDYDVTLRATNAYGTADRRFTGTIKFYTNSALTGVAKPKQKLGDFYHSIRLYVRVAGTFRTPIPRD